MRRDVVARAMRLIADGTVDRDGVTGLATDLATAPGSSNGTLVAEVGAGPLALARAQRAQTARVLIETTGLPFADVAFASGFASIRQFNDTVRARVRRYADVAPGPCRGRGSRRPPPGVLTLRLPFRPPFSPDSLFGHLAADRRAGLRGGARRCLPPDAPSAEWLGHRGPHPDPRPCAVPAQAGRPA